MIFVRNCNGNLFIYRKTEASNFHNKQLRADLKNYFECIAIRNILGMPF